MSEETFTQGISRFLRELALQLPETSEGSSCVNRAFKVRKKNFLFVGEKEDHVRVMVKLGPSLDPPPDDPRVDIGGTGWVTLRMPFDQPLERDQLRTWVRESYRLLAPKTLARQLTDP